jgi:integrase/recombinase XerD
MTIEDFARYFHQPPDALGPERVREYKAYRFRERKLVANTVNQRVGALRFFFIKTPRLHQAALDFDSLSVPPES